MISKSKQSGFTLSELLVVLLLLGLITSVGPVAVKKMVPSIALDSAVQVLEADVELLRAQTVMTNIPGELLIENDGNGYSMSVADKTIKRRKVQNGVFLIGRSQNDKTIANNELRLVSGLDGRISGPDLILKRGTRTRIITINPVFGSIEIASQVQ